jgi:hypothetical protein
MGMSASGHEKVLLMSVVSISSYSQALLLSMKSLFAIMVHAYVLQGNPVTLKAKFAAAFNDVGKDLSEEQRDKVREHVLTMPCQCTTHALSCPYLPCSMSRAVQPQERCCCCNYWALLVEVLQLQQ